VVVDDVAVSDEVKELVVLDNMPEELVIEIVSDVVVIVVGVVVAWQTTGATLPPGACHPAHVKDCLTQAHHPA
jgi:hypothetical protein